jgi:hypothetical protein
MICVKLEPISYETTLNLNARAIQKSINNHQSPRESLKNTDIKFILNADGFYFIAGEWWYGLRSV